LSLETIQFRMYRWVALTAVLTTLVVTPWLTFDPINLGKIIVVTIGSFLFLGLAIANKKYVLENLGKPFSLSLLFFLLGLFLNLVFAPAPFTQKFWGVFGRNNGALSYFALLLLVACAASIRNINYYRKFVYALPLTAIPVSAYCLLQIANLDPIDWSLKATFATLGNVNFLSAFLGLASVALFAMIFQPENSKRFKTMIVFSLFFNLFIINSTDSIQGFAVFVSGSVLIAFFELKRRNFLVSIAFSIVALATFSMSLLALLNQGPLARFIYQPSITFRFDYMQAAWKTFLSNPLFGVGMDGFGDWYRTYRGVISAYRTGTSRTSNSAHNVFLDIASGGGLVLFVPTLLIFGYTFFIVVKALRNMHSFDSSFIALVALWIGYLSQALISINQIGVGVWGWIFTGVVFGYAKCLIEPSGASQVREQKSAIRTKSSKSGNSPRISNLDAKSSILVFIFACIGFVLAFIPFKADMDIRAASNRGDLKGMIENLSNPGATAFHYSQVAFQAFQGGFPDQAKEINTKLLEKFPRDFGGLLTEYSRAGTDLELASLARQKVEAVDPLFYCLRDDWFNQMASTLLSLPVDKQIEISRFWNLVPGGARANSIAFVNLPPEAWKVKLASNCG